MVLLKIPFFFKKRGEKGIPFKTGALREYMYMYSLIFLCMILIIIHVRLSVFKPVYITAHFIIKTSFDKRHMLLLIAYKQLQVKLL